jgi:hypothetical protein
MHFVAWRLVREARSGYALCRYSLSRRSFFFRRSDLEGANPKHVQQANKSSGKPPCQGLADPSRLYGRDGAFGSPQQRRDSRLCSRIPPVQGCLSLPSSTLLETDSSLLLPYRRSATRRTRLLPRTPRERYSLGAARGKVLLGRPGAPGAAIGYQMFLGAPPFA